MIESTAIYSKFLLRCCRARRQIVRSMKGGFVRQNCEQCGEHKAIQLEELPEIICGSCGETMKRARFDLNYAYTCNFCDVTQVLWELLPWYYDVASFKA